ncbi:MAG: DUF5050 domain-containing protein [Lachnospiraceae bacterium]
MKKKHPARKWIMIALIIVIICAGFLIRHYRNRTLFNTTDIAGNSSGNYFNKGLFCEYNGTVYFSNPYDKYTLYEMTPEGTQAKQISEDTVSYINADDHYIYYVRDNVRNSNDNAFSFLKINTNCLCRVNHKGKQLVFLDKDPSIYAALLGNTIYYIHYDKKEASTLYSVKIDGSERKQRSKSPLLLAPSSSGKLCYNGLDQNHNIWLWDSATNTSSTAYSGNCWNPMLDSTYYYFMDCDNDFHLTQVQKSNQQKTDLSNHRVDCYNIYGNYAYYQVNDKKKQGLYRKSLNASSQEELILEGNYCDINITSNYVYFRSYQSKDDFFQTPTSGPVAVTPLTFSKAEK